MIKSKNESRGVIFFIIITMILVIGCASGSTGKYKLSDEVRKTFISFQILPDHNYYYSGPNDRPEGILAVHKSYTLTSADLWWKADADSKQLKSWVDEMRKNTSRLPYGYNISTPDGKQIGVLYTPWDQGILKMKGEHQVEIGLPSRDTERMRAPRLLR